MTLSSSPSSTTTIPSTFLGLLAASVGLPFVAAAENNVTVEQFYGKLTSTVTPAPGFNAEGGSVFTNYADTYNNGQLLLIRNGIGVFESPDSDTRKGDFFYWCSDLTFSDVNNSSLIGYAGRCVMMGLFGYDEAVASGGHFTYSEGEFMATFGISAVFVEQLNIFEGQTHANTDGWVFRYWDDGRKTMPVIGWKGHDEGDMRPNAATSSVSQFAEETWMSVEEVAQLFNTSVDEFTPEKFKQVYQNTWIKEHEKEAATQNPNPGPELAIIEQVKNETNYVDETTATAPVQPDSTATEEGGNSDGVNPVEDDSGSGRQLVSIAARFVSAALRVFGI